MSRKKQDIKPSATPNVLIPEIILPNLPKPSQTYQFFHGRGQSNVSNVASGLENDKSPQKPHVPTSPPASSLRLLPVNPSKKIIGALLASDSLITRKEREAPKIDELKRLLRAQIPDLTNEDLDRTVEMRKASHEQFLLMNTRDRKGRIEPLKEIFPFLTNEELIEILNQETEGINKIYDMIEDWGFLTEIRKKVALKYTSPEEMPQNTSQGSDEAQQEEEKDDDQDEYEEPSNHDSDGDDDFSLRRQSRRDSKKEKSKQKVELESISDVDSFSEVNSLSESDDWRVVNKKRKKSSSKKRKRLKLDEAILNNTSSNPFAGWSKARIQAYKSIDTNPNAYYYRFNAPGIPQRHGQWTVEENDLFMERLKGFDVSSPKWGIFSQSIPGRVGYQCANYYRYLVKEGLIQDSNYVVEKGRIRMMRKGKRGGAAPTSTIENSTTNTQAPPTERQHDDGIGKRIHDNPNPLPGFIDCITQDEVVNPYLSPYGHVLSYNTWRRILNPNIEDAGQFVKNQCPFTKQKLSKRNLIQLTVHNLEVYREKILNL